MKGYDELKKMVLGDDGPPDTVKLDYRSTFDTDVGRRVLTHMLTELHFFDEAVSEEEITLSNYARRILSHLGILRGNRIPDIVNYLMSIKTYGGTNEKNT